MPEGVLLSYVNLRNAFLDRKSEEKGTTRVKAKYKLLTQKDTTLTELGVFVFHVLTTGDESYIQSKSIDILFADWEYRDGTHLGSTSSKLCTQKVDVMNKESLLAKIRDTENRFSHTGTLQQKKFSEVIEFIKKDFEKTDSKTDFDVKEIVNAIFDKKQIVEQVLNKFGL